MPFVKCLNCGKEFYVKPSGIKRGQGKFCSIKCRSEYWKKTGARKKEKIKKICLNCGKVFYVIPCYKDRKFCSKDCQIEWMRKHQVGNNHPRWKPKPRAICIYCGREFEQKEPDQKFCSWDCYIAWRKHKQNEQIALICQYCGKIFYVASKREIRKFCSKECQNAWKSELMHLRQLKNEFEMSSEVIEYIDGLLLSDGHIRPTKSGKYTANYSQFFSIKHLDWAELILKDFKKFGIEANLKIITHKSYKIREEVHLFTKAYKNFKVFRDRWYPNGYKSIPNDLKLTPTVCLNWYLGDGSLHVSGGIRFATNSFKLEDILILQKLLKRDVKVISTIHRWCDKQYLLYIPKVYSKKFLKYIGDCPVSSFEYKWNI